MLSPRTRSGKVAVLSRTVTPSPAVARPPASDAPAMPPPTTTTSVVPATPRPPVVRRPRPRYVARGTPRPCEALDVSRIHTAARGRPPTPSIAEHASAPALAVDGPGRLAEIDHDRMHADRLAKVRAQLVRHGYGAALLSDPMNIRYATGTRNMQVWTLHAPGRYVFVPVEGPVVLFEFGTTRHLSAGFATIDEHRVSTSPFYFLAGPRLAEKVELWA